MKSTVMALLAMSAVVAHAQSPARLVLQGRVVVLGSNSPVPLARLVAAKIEGTRDDYQTVTADASGRFVIADLTPGSYRVYAEHAGYLRAEFGRTPVAQAGTPIAVDERSSPVELVVAMTPTGVIAGRVIERGRPVRNAIVRALRATYRDGQRILAVSEYGTSDDRGEYRLIDLAPGSYFVTATPADRPRLDDNMLIVRTTPTNANSNRSEARLPLTVDTVPAAAFLAGVYPAVFYPGVADSAGATAIDVEAGATILGIDIPVARTATYRIRGRVEAAGITPAPTRIRVSLAPAESTSSVGLPSVDVPLGEFELTGVPPGRYLLGAQALPPEGARTSSLVITRVPVEVSDRDAGDVVAVLQPGVVVSGRVLVDGAAPSGEARPSVQLIGMNGLPGSSATRVGPDGTFAINNVAPGTYRWRVIQLGAGPRIPLWVTSARLGATDVSSRLLGVGPGTGQVRFDIDISSQTASLDAIVLDDRRRPVAGVLVMAVPDPSRRGQSEAFRSGVTDSAGRVRIEGMAPGDYTVFATESIVPDAWQDPAVLKRHEARGERVSFKQSEVRIVELRITS